MFVFELVDEWFKMNWNTEDLDRDRKAWHNTLSSEQYYGLIATQVRPRSVAFGAAVHGPPAERADR